MEEIEDYKKHSKYIAEESNGLMFFCEKITKKGIFKKYKYCIMIDGEMKNYATFYSKELMPDNKYKLQLIKRV